VPELTGLPESLDSSYLGFWLTDSVYVRHVVLCPDTGFKNLNPWTQTMHILALSALLHDGPGLDKPEADTDVCFFNKNYPKAHFYHFYKFTVYIKPNCVII
jgi:hypothetical protein